MPLRLYRCPRCGHEVEALGGTITHPCPKAPTNRRHVELKRVEATTPRSR